MAKRRRRVKSLGLERLAFLVLLVVVAGLLVASSRIGENSDEPPRATSVQPAETLRSAGLTAIIGESAVIPARSAAGRRRDRIRVVFAVQLRSNAKRPVSARRALRLEYSGRRVRPDTAAKERGVLDLTTPMAPGSSRAGEVRFELAGSNTRSLRARGDARLLLVAPEGRPDGVTVELDVPSS